MTEGNSVEGTAVVAVESPEEGEVVLPLKHSYFLCTIEITLILCAGSIFLDPTKALSGVLFAALAGLFLALFLKRARRYECPSFKTSGLVACYFEQTFKSLKIAAVVTILGMSLEFLIDRI